jgi:hypothetical protein
LTSSQFVRALAPRFFCIRIEHLSGKLSRRRAASFTLAQTGNIAFTAKSPAKVRFICNTNINDNKEKTNHKIEFWAARGAQSRVFPKPIQNLQVTGERAASGGGTTYRSSADNQEPLYWGDPVR